MSVATQLALTDCEQRAKDAWATAELLREQENEWQAVCYFYAAYHTVKAALLKDPIFNSATELSRVDSRLTMADRQVQMHKARLRGGQSRDLGLNDIVKLLYKGIVYDYTQLHDLSVQVRYKLELPQSRFADAKRYGSRVVEAYAAGELEYKRPN